MKQAIFTGLLVMALIGLSIFILGAGMAMWLTFKVLYALWCTVGMVFKAFLFPLGSMITAPCHY